MNDVNKSGSVQRRKWTTYQRYVIFLLLIVYTFNFIDRQIVTILSPAIKEDLGLTDTELGLLKGLPFALFYAVFGFPIAWLADRYSRSKIIAAAIAVWSGMTVLCGLAQNYGQLLAARMGVGVGEAGCSPAAHSLISDYFPKEERASALGLYSLGISFGTLFGILLGGLIADAYGWRWAFIVVGAPGIFMGLIVLLTLREPVRGAMDSKKASGLSRAVKSVQADLRVSAAPPSSFKEALKTMVGIKSYVILTISAALTAFCGYGLGLWIVDFLFRTHELGYRELTIPLSMCIGVGGGIGVVFGGYITDYLARKSTRAYFSYPAYGHLISVPLFFAAVWVGSPMWCFIIFFFVFMLHSSVAGPYYALVQNLAPPQLRAFAAALFMFVLSVIGLGLGPLYLGFLSDLWAPKMGEADALRWAITTLGPIWALASFIMLSGRNVLETDLASRADQDS